MVSLRLDDFRIGAITSRQHVVETQLPVGQGREQPRTGDYSALLRVLHVGDAGFLELQISGLRVDTVIAGAFRGRDLRVEIAREHAWNVETRLCKPGAS